MSPLAYLCSFTGFGSCSSLCFWFYFERTCPDVRLPLFSPVVKVSCVSWSSVSQSVLSFIPVLPGWFVNSLCSFLSSSSFFFSVFWGFFLDSLLRAAFLVENKEPYCLLLLHLGPPLTWIVTHLFNCCNLVVLFSLICWILGVRLFCLCLFHNTTEHYVKWDNLDVSEGNKRI